MKKKQHKVTLYKVTEDIIDAFSFLQFECGGEIPKRIGANELVMTIGEEQFLIKVTRHES